MKKRQLGISELFISEISLGGMSLSTDKKQAAAIVDMALDAGLIISTQRIYMILVQTKKSLVQR